MALGIRRLRKTVAREKPAPTKLPTNASSASRSFTKAYSSLLTKASRGNYERAELKTLTDAVQISQESKRTLLTLLHEPLDMLSGYEPYRKGRHKGAKTLSYTLKRVSLGCTKRMMTLIRKNPKVTPEELETAFNKLNFRQKVLSTVGAIAGQLMLADRLKK